MALDEFVTKYNGQRIADTTLTGLPPEQRHQCVSLIKGYLSQVIGIQPGAWGDARVYWEKPNPALLTKFSKTIQQPAQKGDIVVFKPHSTNGQAGHIGIALDSNTMLEQNGGSGTGKGKGNDAVRISSIPYSKLYGILRKGEDMFEGKTAQQWAKEAKYNASVAIAREDMLNRIALAAGDDLDAVEEDDVQRIIANIDKLNKQVENSKGQFKPINETVYIKEN